MLWTLLTKDWHRIRKKPGPYLLMLALPLAITTLIGLVFGSSGGGPSLPPIRVAFADEDGAFMAGVVKSALSQGPVEIITEDVPFDDGLRRLQDGDFSAVIRVPESFTEKFFEGKDIPPLELVKNPAQGYLPVIIEEIVLFLGELLNAFSRNLSDELAEIRAAIEGDEVPDPVLMGALAQKIFTKFQRAGDYLFPPIIQSENEEREKEEEAGPSINIFAYLLPGITALFLLFLADIGIRDLFDEERARTLQRYRTLSANTFPLVLSKTLLAMTVVLAGAFILLGIGGLAFGIAWRNPLAIIVLSITYAAYAAGLLTALAALVGTEKRANVVNTIAIFIVGFLGGSMMPIDNLPSALTDTLSPYMPTYWFGQTIVKLQSGEAEWMVLALKMLVLGTVLVLIATRLINRRLAKGIR